MAGPEELLFGIHSVEALLLRAPQRVASLCLLQGRADKRLQSVVDLAATHNLPVEWLARRELDSLVEGNHQGVVARVRLAREYNANDLDALLNKLSDPPFLLVLDGVTDPHNLGACLRSAEAAGVHAVIAPKDNAAGLTPVARKVSCGASEVIPYVTVTNLARQLRALQDRGIWLIGAAGEAGQSIYEVDCKGALAIVMGAEGGGLRRLTRECCDYLAKIPMAGSVSSLNVSVATGICLFEALRQRALVAKQ
jgi:23S rRNA (guanosine2251-2'-O)-methyltransferase